MVSSTSSFNKFRSAMSILQRGRQQLLEDIADEVLDKSEDFADAPFLFNEFLENQGTKLHFLGLLVSQMEQSADELEDHRLTVEFENKATQDAQSKAAPKSRSKAKPKPSADTKSSRTRASSSSKKLENQQSASHRKPNADEG